jgi:hypothetical protein
VNLDDAVRAGLTALPNAAADAAGGLPISDAGELDLDAIGDAAADLSDIDAVMLREATRQGYRAGRDQIVAWAATAADRGVNLVAAQTAIEALDPAPSATDWVTLFLPPWVHEVASGDTWGTNYVHYRALFPEKGGDRMDTDCDRYDGATLLSEYRPPSTQVVCSVDGVTTITQSATVLRMTGFAISQLSGGTTGSFHALAVTADTNVGSQYDPMYYWHKSPYTDYQYGGTFRSPVAFVKHVSGVWRDCIANSLAWRVGYDAANAGQFSARMYRCQGGAYSFIGDYPNGREGTHKATNCWLEDCIATGSRVSTSTTYPSGSGSFSGCLSWGCDIDATCYFIRCRSGQLSYGLGATNLGYFEECYGLECCFGATSDSSHASNFAGTAIRCFGLTGSFGGNYAMGGGVLSGKLKDCICLGGGTITHKLQGATIDGCLFTVTSTNYGCFTLLDSLSRIHNSTVLVVEGGTGIAIDAATAKNVSAIGNRYNNSGAAGQVNGLGTNVTNVGSPSTVTTDAASRTGAGTAAAAAILSNPEWPIVTDETGSVNLGGAGNGTILPEIAAAVEAALVDDGDAYSVMGAIGAAARDAVLDSILTGTHDVAGSLGKLIQDAATGEKQSTIDDKLNSVLEDTGTTGVCLTVAERNAIADAKLLRSVEHVVGSLSGLTGSDLACEAIAILGKLRAKVVGSNILIYSPDGTEPVAILPVISDSDADPMTGVGVL